MAEYTDNQRRGVARRLLSLNDSTAGEIAQRMNLLPTEVLGDILVTALGLFVALGEAGLDAEGADGIWALLASLIDRPTCRNVSGCQDVFECSECRCRAELVTEVCNEHGEPFHVPLMPSFCPNCGAMVTEKEEDDG